MQFFCYTIFIQLPNLHHEWEIKEKITEAVEASWKNLNAISTPLERSLNVFKKRFERV